MNALVIDIGTSSMRGILYEENGRKLAMQQEKYEVEKHSDGRIEQAPESWIDALNQICCNIAEKARQKKADISAVVITAQRSSVIPVDCCGHPLMNAIMWQDSRNAAICGKLEPFKEVVLKKSGAALNPVFSGSKMTWIVENRPEIASKVFKYMNVPEYVTHVMTGGYRTDVTYGSRSHLMNLAERKWDDELLHIFRVREDQLCELQEPGMAVGNVTAEFSRMSGLPEGIPVVSSGGDQQCAVVGQGVFRKGILSLTAGTGGFLMAALDKIPETLSASMICNCSSVSGQYVVEANVLTCCSAFDWYCKNFYDWEGGKTDYARISQDLEALDGCVGVPLILPYFQGKSIPVWNAGAQAVFCGISLNTSRRELLKALLEAVFMELKNGIELFENDMDISQMHINGGLTKSPVINQIMADVFGIPLLHMQDSESTAIGALITALVGLGVYPTFDAAYGQVRQDAEIEYFYPRAEIHEKYEQKRSGMNQLYQQLYGNEKKSIRYYETGGCNE